MEEMIIQNRHISQGDIQLIKELIRKNPSWGRTRLSQELCSLWDWRSSSGQVKDMACRTLLLKLEKSSKIVLPPRKFINTKKSGSRYAFKAKVYFGTSIREKLCELKPISIRLAVSKGDRELFRYFLQEYHYLGYKGSIGENLKYIVCDKQGTILSLLLFGSAAWSLEARDNYIGWDNDQRRYNLQFITNNTRYLILPWIKVSHLASYVLGQISHRINRDWQKKYGHSIYLLETFIEGARFKGTCYKASNWVHIGRTKGRTRNDRYSKIKVSVKEIYLYPLCKDFKERLVGRC